MRKPGQHIQSPFPPPEGNDQCGMNNNELGSNADRTRFTSIDRQAPRNGSRRAQDFPKFRMSPFCCRCFIGSGVFVPSLSQLFS
jgi:hypothetical protein